MKKKSLTFKLNFLSCLLHFLVSGTGTVFRIRFRFRCRSPQMNTVPTGSGSGSATLLWMPVRIWIQTEKLLRIWVRGPFVIGSWTTVVGLESFFTATYWSTKPTLWNDTFSFTHGSPIFNSTIPFLPLSLPPLPSHRPVFILVTLSVFLSYFLSFIFPHLTLPLIRIFPKIKRDTHCN
jgi:hypothetical protein